MPDDIKVNDLPNTEIVNDTDTFMLVQNNTSTKQVDVESVADHLLNEMQFSELPGVGKTVISAIKEVATSGLELTGTLLAYETMLKLYNAGINRSSTVDVYTDAYNVVPTDVVASIGVVTLTFKPYTEDHQVKVRIT